MCGLHRNTLHSACSRDDCKGVARVKGRTVKMDGRETIGGGRDNVVEEEGDPTNVGGNRGMMA